MQPIPAAHRRRLGRRLRIDGDRGSWGGTAQGGMSGAPFPRGTSKGWRVSGPI